MNSLRYKLLRFAGPTFDGSNDQFDVEMAAKAKYSPDNPYEVANEMIALRLGLALGLPVPLRANASSRANQIIFRWLAEVKASSERFP